jgi:hypothetical protein
MRAALHPSPSASLQFAAIPEDRQRAKAALAMIEVARKQRMFLLRNGAGHVDHAHGRILCDRLKSWLDTNPHASIATLQAFWRGPLGEAFRTIIPHRAGDERMHRFKQLINLLPR